MSRIPLSALILILALPSALLAQDERLERLRQVYPAEAVGRIEEVIAAAEAANVPSDPLVTKALEGAAKGVPADRVIAALSGYADRLGEATRLIGSPENAMDVVATADALRRGVPAPTVQRLVGDHRGSLSVPLVVLGDLIDAGVSAEGAFEVVHSALAAEQGPEELLAIPGAVRRLVKEGRSPADAANAVGKAIGRGRNVGGAVGPQGSPQKGPPGGPPVPPGAGPPADKKAKKKGPPGGD